MKQNKYYHSEIRVKDNKNWPKIEVTTEQIELIKKYNHSKNIKEKKYYGKQLPKELFAICRFCGERIINLNFHITVKNNVAHHTSPEVYSRIIEDNEYILSCCENCLIEHFKNNAPKSPKYYFMKGNKFGMYSFGYSYDEYKKITSMTVGITEKSMIRKWGKEEGIRRWKEYCKKQSVTNTFEYKKEKYGWTDEKFKKFNESRAVTYENLLNKYKDPDKAKAVYDHYVNEQKRTKSWDYMVEKFGEDKAREINQSKALTLENFIKKYGEDLGKIKYKEYYEQTNNSFYSKISQKCFDELDEIIGKKYITFYASKNSEKMYQLSNKLVMLDYFIKDLNICVEFNGNCFHGNPRMYKDDETPNPWSNLTAKQLRENDQQRYKELKEMYNIDTYVIWEDDYRHGFNAEDFIINTLKINIL